MSFPELLHLLLRGPQTPRHCLGPFQVYKSHSGRGAELKGGSGFSTVLSGASPHSARSTALMLAWEPHAPGSYGGPGPPGYDQTKEARTSLFFTR